MSGLSVEAAGAFVAALALGVSAWSMLYLARQTRSVADQTRAATEQTVIINAMAAVSANDTVIRSLREVHILMLDRPGARACFYDGAPLPHQPEAREAVVTLAELLADVLNVGVHAHRELPDSASAGAWTDYCRHALASSPVLRDLVRAHPTWWPDLTRLLPEPGS